jgi:hypothetical protein
MTGRTTLVWTHVKTTGINIVIRPSVDAPEGRGGAVRSGAQLCMASRTVCVMTDSCDSIGVILRPARPNGAKQGRTQQNNQKTILGTRGISQNHRLTCTGRLQRILESHPAPFPTPHEHLPSLRNPTVAITSRKLRAAVVTPRAFTFVKTVSDATYNFAWIPLPPFTSKPTEPDVCASSQYNEHLTLLSRPTSSRAIRYRFEYTELKLITLRRKETQTSSQTPQ